MLGALTFLPTFMQFVDGVSATESGLRTLPMVAGMLITSIGSGNIVGRTGQVQGVPRRGDRDHGRRHSCCCRRWTAATPTWQQSVYLFVLGTGIGLCMQVLVLVVQNTSSFADLGVATSGVTFFRTIGSSFGAAIFGSLFANFLAGRIGPALIASGAPPAAAQSPKALHELSPTMAAPIVERLRGLAGHRVPLRGAGRRRRLRRRAVPQGGAASRDGRRVGHRPRRGLRHAEHRATPDKILEVAVGRMFRDSPEMRLRSLAGRPGCDLDVASLWALVQIYRQNQVFGSATADGHRRAASGAATRSSSRRSTASCVDRGYALRHRRAGCGSPSRGSGRGRRRIGGDRRPDRRQVVPLAPSFEGHADREEVEAALERIAHRHAGAAGLGRRPGTRRRSRLIQKTRTCSRIAVVGRTMSAMSRIGDFADDDAAGMGRQIARHRYRHGRIHPRGLHQEPTSDAGSRTGTHGDRLGQRMRGVPEHSRFLRSRSGRRRRSGLTTPPNGAPGRDTAGRSGSPRSSPERFASDHTALRDDEDFWARCSEQFDDELLTDLALSCAMWVGMGRMLRTLDIGQSRKITL